MKTKLKFLGFLILVAAAIIPAQAKTIAVTFTIISPPYLTMVRDAIVAEAAKTPGLKLDVREYNNEVPKQMADMPDLMGKHPDALIIFIQDGAAGAKVNEMAVAAHIPVVYLLSVPSVDKLPANAAVVSSNGYVAGRLQMHKLAALMGGKGNLVILRGTDTSTDTKGRTQGVKEIAAKYPNIHLIDEGSAIWNRPDADKLVTSWLEKGDKIDAVAANNDDMALGAVDALERAKVAHYFVGGVDGSASGLAEMQKGRLTLTVLQNAAAQGREAVDDAVSLMNGKAVQQYDWVPFELVTKEVLPAYLPK